MCIYQMWFKENKKRSTIFMIRNMNLKLLWAELDRDLLNLTVGADNLLYNLQKKKH
jgi:hypothetical protein